LEEKPRQGRTTTAHQKDRAHHPTRLHQMANPTRRPKLGNLRRTEATTARDCRRTGDALDMTKQIPLSQGLFALVDDADFEWLNQWKWSANKIGNTFYAIRKERKRPFQKTIYMHREIMNTPKGVQVDHINRDGLNDTRANMRNCTIAENSYNRKRVSTNHSGYKGVSWSKPNQKWMACIKMNNRSAYLGYFDTAEDAARAYDQAAKLNFGAFASLNFPLEQS